MDGVGIGSHGYCYIEDEEANIIYHPQQQLIYSGLRDSNNPRIKTFIQSLVDIREDVVAVMIYDKDGEMMSSWSNGKTLKKDYYKNLSYVEPSDGELHISKPHVETLYEGFYPWVVTISQTLEDEAGEKYVIAVDIRFSNISDYVDGVGIGSHGYCYIEDEEANIKIGRAHV